MPRRGSRPSSYATGYGELESRASDGTRSYRKTETSDEIFSKLADSGYPAAMLAVTACMIGKLNSKTRRGAKPVNLMPHQQAFRKLKESGKEITLKNYQIALRREKFEVVLMQNQTSKTDRENLIAKAKRGQFRAKWVRDYLRQYKTPAEKRVDGDSPTAESSKGTPAQSIDYIHGAKLTRQMASYWRRHRRFQDCLRFMKSLLKRDRPSVPSEEFWRMPYDYYFNGEIEMYFKVRQLEKQTALASKRTRH